MYVASAFLVTVLLISTCLRNGLWHSPLRIWLDTSKKTPMSARVHNNVGMSYVLAGNIPAAILEFRAAFELDEYYYQAYYNLGRCLELTGSKGEALTYLEKYCTYGPPDVLKADACDRAEGLRRSGEVD